MSVHVIDTPYLTMIEDSSTKQNIKVHICTKNIISILCVIFIYYWVSYKLPGL